MNIKKQADLIYGDKLEQHCITQFNDYFKCTLNKISINSIIDFIDDESKIVIELKGRRCRKHQYNDTMIGTNKLYEAKKYIDKGYSCYFAFSFIDKLCYYQYDGTINNKWIREGGRCDRGCTETNSYYHIPCTLLKDIK
jgi:hypothetical protein